MVRVSRYAACALLLVVGLMLLWGTFDFAVHRGDYHFGTEVGGVFYRSKACYLGGLAIQWLVIIGNIAALRTLSSRPFAFLIPLVSCLIILAIFLV